MGFLYFGLHTTKISSKVSVNNSVQTSFRIDFWLNTDWILNKRNESKMFVVYNLGTFMVINPCDNGTCHRGKQVYGPPLRGKWTFVISGGLSRAVILQS
jgi:hypothetical protein